MAAFQKFDSFVEALGRAVHDLNNDTLKVMLTSVAPTSTDATTADLTEITPGFGYLAGGRPVLNSAYSETGGVGLLTGGNVIFTATGGNIGPVQWAVLYNSTALTNPLIGWWDSGSPATVSSGGTLTVDVSGGILDLQ